MDRKPWCKLPLAFLWLSLAACPNKPEVATKAIQLATGVNHSCALLDTSDIKCWGNNLLGQLGVSNKEAIGADEISTTSNVVLGGKALQLDAGDFFTCALLVLATPLPIRGTLIWEVRRCTSKPVYTTAAPS
jgi:hypothetical protein